MRGQNRVSLSHQARGRLLMNCQNVRASVGATSVESTRAESVTKRDKTRRLLPETGRSGAMIDNGGVDVVVGVVTTNKVQ